MSVVEGVESLVPRVVLERPGRQVLAVERDVECCRRLGGRVVHHHDPAIVLVERISAVELPTYHETLAEVGLE